jgi:homoserine O-acetyltransferase
LGYIGPGAVADTDHYFVVALDALGNGVSSLPDGPISIGDMVVSQHRVVTDALELSHVAAVLGLSMGGHQTIEWMLRFPDFMDQAVAVAGSPRATGTDRAAHQPEIDLIAAFGESSAAEPQLLRVLTSLHVRNIFHPDFFNTLDTAGLNATVDEWLGIANTQRFKAAHWRAQWEAMLKYDAYAGRGSVAEVGASVQAQVLSVTCVDDACVDPTSQQELAAAIPAARTLELHGSAGHLNLFTEMETLREATTSFLRI